ncbi:unnamed protein product [Coffea canephora]|uniref:Uncharacterized protein n=1 Tax=Coffea canephora TaxID=49390 RepID=A0A068UP73_COFCA|nr:unnamed protein product [Coffea canephora]
MTSKTFASPMFIFFWLLMISIILVQPALSGRTLGGSGGGSMIGVDPSRAPKATGGSSLANSAPKDGGGGSIGHVQLPRRPMCNSRSYARCLQPAPGRPCHYYSGCRPPLPPK